MIEIFLKKLTEVEIFISSNRKISVIANFLQDSTNKETEELYHLQNNV